MDKLVPYFVYRQFSASGTLLYIGCTSMPGIRTRPWFSKVKFVTMEKYNSKSLGQWAKGEAIVREKPKFNKHKNRSGMAKKEVFKALRKKGWTLQKIGNAQQPKVSRQYVFQVLNDELFKLTFTKKPKHHQEIARKAGLNRSKMYG